MKQKPLPRLLALLILTAFSGASLVAQDFLHTDGKAIVDANNEPVIIRSMGIGSWMLQEGYHMNTAGIADTQHEIENKLAALTSEEFKDTFYDLWLANHFTKRDLDSLKAWGFNAIRPALHYQWFTPAIENEPVSGEITWRQKGFDLLDSLIQWCTANEMYLILDLHAAPGGQGYNAPISDYNPDKPSLWESEANKRKTAALWKKIAERCVNEPWIGGYDLINETNWTFEGNFDGNVAKNGCQDTLNAPLRALMEEITDSIRKVDNNHIIFIEGNCWANNFNGMTPPWDDNMVYSFHRYWTPNTTATIQQFLDMREEYNIPLWLGETGENSNTWFTECIQLMEAHDIGWSWWTEKQLNDIDDPFIIPSNPDYERVLDYWSGEGARPAQETVKNGFLQLAADAKLENCTWHKDVIDAMFRQVETAETKPFKTHVLPGRIFAADYDLGRVNHAYYDKVYENTDMNTTPNQGSVYRNDGVDIEPCSDKETNGYNVGWIEDGEWMQYTVNVSETGDYRFQFRIASDGHDGTLKVKIDGQTVVDGLSLPATGGWQNWQTVSAPAVKLEEGSRKIRILASTGGFNLNYMDVEQATGKKK